MKFIFKEETTFEQRKAESSSIRLKYPERVPVIIEKVHGTFVNEMDKKKFLIPSDISMSQLVWIIRKRIHMEPERALYIYVGKTMPLARISTIRQYVIVTASPVVKCEVILVTEDD